MEIFISVVALAVSVATAGYAMLSRARVRAMVRRHGTREGDRGVFVGDDVIIFNVGRSPAIITAVEAIRGEDNYVSPARTTLRDGQELPFPQMPFALEAHSAFVAPFSESVSSDVAGVELGFRVMYIAPGMVRRGVRQRTLIVRADSRWDATIPEGE